MGHTIAEKIMAAHCGREEVYADEYVNAKVDFIVGNESTSVLAIEGFRRLGCDRIFDKDRILILTDHSIPNNSIAAAEYNKTCREFSKEFGLEFYEVGRVGICHVMVPDKGYVVPGDIVIGADSHTCTYGALGAMSTGMGSTDMLHAMVFGEIWMRVPETIKVVLNGKVKPGVVGKDLILYVISQIGVEGANYKAIEFCGEALDNVSLSSRFTMANMVIEAGAKCCFFNLNQETLNYLEERARRPYKVYTADEDARYCQVVELDVSDLEPQVAVPSLPENAKPVSEVERDHIRVDQVFFGSCTNGRTEDMMIAAQILEGKKLADHVRMIVIPGSQEVYMESLKKGYIQTMLEAGCAICTPNCGACGGRHMGVLAAGEVCLSTTARNFTGRMGHKDSFVYLSGPAVAAASAVAGYICGPESV